MALVHRETFGVSSGIGDALLTDGGYVRLKAEALSPASSREAPAKRRHFLMISTPFGPFARELAHALREQGARVSRVILNAGDLLDWRHEDAFAFRGDAAGWRGWLTALAASQDVTDFLTYGDSSVYAAGALATAPELGVRVHVLEQGYFRPDWITLEGEGVNANSPLPRDPTLYLAHEACTPEPSQVLVGRAMPAAVLWLFRYHLALYLGHAVFPRYRTGYRRSAFLQAVGHAVRYVLRDALVHGHAERRRAMFAAPGPVFLVLLQRPGDSQLWRHSRYESTADFLDHVIGSFAAHAPADARLMVRPHPLDPGLDPHERVMRRLAARNGVAERVAFVDDGKLHEILPAIAGAVCVNSTAGLAAIEFGRPAIVLGKAMYDMPGLTHQGGLDAFWTRPEEPSADLYRAFRRIVIARTQVNGAFATRRGRALAVPEVARRLMESRLAMHAACSVNVDAEDRGDRVKMSLPGR